MGKRKTRRSPRPKKKDPKQGRLPSIYEPLPEGGYIRVLVLQRGNYEDEIVCHLESQSYDSPRKYSAISYVWGDPSAIDQIQCNAHPVTITKSLADALRRFRSPRKVKRLWADALCINQDDAEEKGHQVTHMGKIYKNAASVLAWLGPDDNNIAEECFRRIKAINDYFEPEFIQNGRDFWKLPIFRPPFPIPVDYEYWAPIDSLMAQPWFTRVWTVQECSLAGRCRMFWGLANIDLADVVEASLWFAWHHNLGTLLEVYDFESLRTPANLFVHAYRHFGRLSWHRSRPALQTVSQIVRQSSFVDLLIYTSRLRATDERDRVYAFLGSAYAKNEHGQPLLDVNYTASIESVNYNLTSALVLSQVEGPLVLDAVSRDSRYSLKYLQYPTWVPQWHDFLGMAGPMILSFHAGGPSSFFSAEIAESRYLEVAGFVFDEIIWKSTQLESSSFLLIPERWTQFADTYELYLDRLWRAVALTAEELRLEVGRQDLTLTLLKNHSQGILDSSVEHQQKINAYRKVAQALLNKNDTFSEKLITNTELEEATLVSETLYTYTLRMCLFLTRGGRIGLGRGTTTEVGDLCSIVMGGKVPYLLTLGNEGRYRLIEKCYIHGVMGGELLGQFKTTTIVIE